MDELIQISDRFGKPVNSAPMRVAFERQLIRLGVQVILRNSQGQFLLQKRAANMLTHPSLWDVSAAGHVDADELPMTAAYRELAEEIGITDVSLTKFKEYYEEEPDSDFGLMRDYVVVFVGQYDRPLDQLTLDEFEVAEVAWCEPAQIDSWPDLRLSSANLMKSL